MSVIVLHKEELKDLVLLGDAMVESKFFKDVTKASEAVVKILAGREVGLGPVEAMRSFHAVNGKVEWTADALAARVKASGRYDYRVERLDDLGCELIFYEHGAEVGPSKFDDADRARAGLRTTDNHGDPTAWAKYPRNMMFSRALTNGVGWYCPDVALGLAPTLASDVAPTMIEADVPESTFPVIALPEATGAAEPVASATEPAVESDANGAEPALEDIGQIPAEAKDEPETESNPAGEGSSGSSEASIMSGLLRELQVLCERHTVSVIGWINTSCSTHFTVSTIDQVTAEQLRQAVDAFGAKAAV